MQYQIAEVIVTYIKNHFKPCLKEADRIYFQVAPNVQHPVEECLLTHLDLYYEYQLNKDPNVENGFYYEILRVNCHSNV